MYLRLQWIFIIEGVFFQPTFRKVLKDSSFQGISFCKEKRFFRIGLPFPSYKCSRNNWFILKRNLFLQNETYFLQIVIIYSQLPFNFLTTNISNGSSQLKDFPLKHLWKIYIFHLDDKIWNQRYEQCLLTFWAPPKSGWSKRCKVCL